MGLKTKMQEGMIGMLEKRYSGIREVVGLLDKVRDNVTNQKIEGLPSEKENKEKKDISGDDIDGGENGTLKNVNETNEISETESVFKPDDGKWRPVLITLGLVYKLQKVSDDHWYDNKDVFMQNREKSAALVDLLGHYWSRSFEIASNIKGEELEELRKNLAEGIEIPVEDVLYVYNKDAEKAVVEEHCPDIALTIDKERKELVLTVCGTKVFPAPSAADIMTDLYAESIPFHNGRAHRGMVGSTHNILAKVFDLLIIKLTELKDYKLIITGYSLGAGVAQLLAICLTDGPEAARLPAGTVFQCVTFGAPPVYASSEPGYVNPNIVSVYNHNDGLAGLSLHTVTRLFLQIRAINRLCLPRCRSLSLLRTKLGHTVVEAGTRKFVALPVEERADGWNRLEAAISAVKKSGFAELTHFAGMTYLVKRADVGHVVRKLEGLEALPLAEQLRMRGGMFNDHMPWGYSNLFKGCGGCTSGYSLDMLKYL